MAGRRGPLSPDRRIFFGQGRGDVRSRALASRLGASIGSRSGSSTADLLFPLIFPPTLISLLPTSGSLAGGTAVTLTGLNFSPGATVTFGGTPATFVVVVASTTITCVTPAHASGAVNVTVTNPDLQSSTLVNGFTYSLPMVAVGTNVAASSIDDGVTWVARTIPVGATYTDVVFTGSSYVAIAQEGKTAISTDGFTWIAGGLLTAGNGWTCLGVDPGGIIVAGAFGNPTFQLARSLDGGATWQDFTARSPAPFAIGWTSTTGFIAFASSGTYGSADGAVWTAIRPVAGFGTGAPQDSFVGLGNICVFATTTVQRVHKSIDGGLNWSFNSMPFAGTYHLAYNGSFYEIVTSGSVAATSPDGVTFTPIVPAYGTPNAFSEVWTGTSFVTIQGRTVGRATDGIAWTFTPNALPAGTWAKLAASHFRNQ